MQNLGFRVLSVELELGISGPGPNLVQAVGEAWLVAADFVSVEGFVA